MDSESLLSLSDSEEDTCPFDEDRCMDRSENDDDEPLNAPKDRYNAIYFIFVLLGLGTLLPWNFLITAESYWRYKFRNVSVNVSLHNNPTNLTHLQVEFPIYLSMGSMIPTLIFMLIGVYITDRVSEKKRINVSFILMTLIFTVITAMVLANTDQWQLKFFTLTMVLIVFINSAVAIFQCSVFGLTSMFPPRITHALLSGQALGGIVASVGRILTLVIGWNISKSTFIFFSLAVIIQLVGLLGYQLLTKTEYYKYYKEKCKDKALLTPINVGVPRQRRSYLQVMRKIEVYAVSAGGVFGITMCVFPAISVLIVSVDYQNHSPWTTTYFIPVACFLLYNTADFIGRTAGGLLYWPGKDSKLIPFFCLARLAFIPLLLLTNVQPRHHLPVVFDSDIWYILFIVLLGLTNGYLAFLCMAYGPKMVNSQDQEIAGTILSFFLVIGLTVGSIFSNILVRIL